MDHAAETAAPARRVRLGMLTPSSNTVLEPVTAAMLAGLDEVTAHFARFRVMEISLGDGALGQFDPAPILAAARLLADARVDVIAWNGTSSGWLGFDTDERLCDLITRETGIASTTAVLALNDVMRAAGHRRIALVTPYLHAVQERVVATYRAVGFDVVAERHLNDPGNFSFAEVSADQIAGMVRAVSETRPDCIITFCTNLRAAPLVDALERDVGVPIYDTVATALHGSLRLASIDPRRITGWGRLFVSG